MQADIRGNIKKFRSNIPEHVQLVAVSKTKPLEDIRAAHLAGQKIFGENRIEELVVKCPALPADIEWHMIGHLQSKKVKKIASFISLIHSVDSEKLLRVINTEASKNDRIIEVLLQFRIAEEESKYGFLLEEAELLLSNNGLENLNNIRVVGVMGMATFSDDEEKVRSEFRKLKGIFDHLKANFFRDNAWFKEISMGMSGDYQIAIEEGSTMVRVGSSIFGSRH